ncbi:MAG: aryl-sulfate sulfotransferase [bacterium]
MICCNLTISIAQTTVGLRKHTAGSNDNGYVLFAPMSDTTTYLIDKCGYVVHKWSDNYFPSLSVYLLPNGKLLKTGVDKTSPFNKGGGGGFIEIIDWDGNVEWTYKLSTTTECQHHDVKYLPNGNILAIVYDKKTLEEVQNAGRDPQLFKNEFWSEKIKELRPIGKDSAEIVWEWKIWDHLVQDFDSTKENYGKVELHPELVDANFGTANQKVDWHHINSIDYNPKLDQILLSSRHFHEIWIIDHSTTTLEAAAHKGGKYGKGGDLLYRWGNPIAYRHGTAEDEQLFYQHDAYWIKEGLPYAGNIMVFNNLRGPNNAKYSSVDIIKQPVNSEGFYDSELPYAPATNEWSYTAPNQNDFLAMNLSSAQMLENGNVLICNGPRGFFFEIDSSKNTVWEYMNPVVMGGIVLQGLSPQLTNLVFRCTFYPDNFSGLLGKDLKRIGTVENINSLSETCTLFTFVEENTEEIKTNLYPNPSENIVNIKCEKDEYSVKVYNMQGRLVISGGNINYINTSDLANGIYMLNISYMSGNYSSKQFIVNR